MYYIFRIFQCYNKDKAESEEAIIFLSYRQNVKI